MTQDTEIKALASPRAAVLVNPGPSFSFSIQPLEIPTLGPQNVLIQLEATSICGSDIALALGHLGPTTPILGHEGIGRVASLGPHCTTSVAVGQRVGVGWLRDACGSCSTCLRGDETRCETKIWSGRDVPGTFASYTVVPERYLTRLPDDIPAENLAPIMCGGITAYKAVKSSQATPGSWMAIFGGAGGVGSLAVQYAKAMGYRVVAVDGGDIQRDICIGAGADVYIDHTTEPSIYQAVVRGTGGLCASAIVCANSAAAYEAAMLCLDVFGVLVCVGILPPPQTVSFNPGVVIDRGIRIIGSLVGSRAEIVEAVEFVRRGVVKPKTEVIRLEDINEHVKRVGCGLDGKLVIRFDEQ